MSPWTHTWGQWAADCIDGLGGGCFVLWGDVYDPGAPDIALSCVPLFIHQTVTEHPLCASWRLDVDEPK